MDLACDRATSLFDQLNPLESVLIFIDQSANYGQSIFWIDGPPFRLKLSKGAVSQISKRVACEKGRKKIYQLSVCFSVKPCSFSPHVYVFAVTQQRSFILISIFPL